MGGINEADVFAHDFADYLFQWWVMSAAEDQGVNPFVFHEAKVIPGNQVAGFSIDIAIFGQGDEQRAGQAENLQPPIDFFQCLCVG